MRKTESDFSNILTRNKDMKAIIKQAKQIAGMDENVLLCGESGTGKEMIARSIHNGSDRSQAPFITVNFAAGEDGYNRKLESAHMGTVFLDDIDKMPLYLQAKILQVIEQREVMRFGTNDIVHLDVRVIASGSQELADKVRDGEFLNALYFRLNCFELKIPSLNDRRDDVLYLFRHFLAEQGGGELKENEMEPDFVRQLKTHDWRGNVRELQNTALRYHVFQGDNSRQEILKEREGKRLPLVTEDFQLDLKSLDRTIEEMVIRTLLERKMTKSDISKTLGISRQALYKKISRSERR